mmetsp:Transcript_111891/g.167540  ORF Transcript_111891/g.167540 Transcript_111891/m.167540 type:complete len:96 (-) Transcript_111891:6-293(-)
MGKKVIMFEDNKLNQRVQSRFLKLAGIECKIVENGKVGIDFLGETETSRLGDFDLVLMDCNMPVMDGFEATKNIREMEKKIKSSTKTCYCNNCRR